MFDPPHFIDDHFPINPKDKTHRKFSKRRKSSISFNGFHKISWDKDIDKINHSKNNSADNIDKSDEINDNKLEMYKSLLIDRRTHICMNTHIEQEMQENQLEDSTCKITENSYVEIKTPKKININGNYKINLLSF